ncbi:MAG: polyphosphate kinase 1 [Acidobacteriota bacterium]
MARTRKSLKLASMTSLAPPPASVEADDSTLFLNRELSWLDFNRRVLAEAEDPSNPLLERLKFVAIFGSNLDEFFMKRVGGLKQQLAVNVSELSPDGRTPTEQLEAINAAVRPMVAAQHSIFLNDLVPELRRNGLEILRWEEVSEGERDHLRRFFESSVFPVLTPLALDPAHPFPFISNLSLSLALSVRHPTTGQERFARIKVPGSIARWIQLPPPSPESQRFVALEDVVAHNLDLLFPGMEVEECHAFRVTRNVEGEVDDDPADDLLESIQEELRERRFATVVRLQVVPEMPPWMRSLLCEELEVSAEDVYEVAAPMALSGLIQLATLPIPALRDTPWRPVTPTRLQLVEGESRDIFQIIAKGDLLVHHPYESFAASVDRFIAEAAADPAVLAIKQTLYRTAKDSPIVKALIEAAERGKQVAVTVELKARFDEARNIEWARALEEAGAHVAYGVVGLKTHTKVTQVVRQEGDGLRTYTHVASGNYNADTAGLYTDLGLFTCRPELGGDATQLFNLLTGFAGDPQFRRLLIAPINMRRRFHELIDREIEHQRAGRGGRIVAKMNALEDSKIVRNLYRASQEGVSIDLIVRGICRLRPGMPTLSENVRVISIVGRFLEHARIFSFGNGGEAEVFFGSADWMSRNLDYRVEAIAPVEDAGLRDEIRILLELQLADNLKAWQLRSDGTWFKLEPPAGEPGCSSQVELMARAAARSGRAS